MDGGLERLVCVLHHFFLRLPLSERILSSPAARPKKPVPIFRLSSFDKQHLRVLAYLSYARQMLTNDVPVSIPPSTQYSILNHRRQLLPLAEKSVAQTSTFPHPSSTIERCSLTGHSTHHPASSDAYNTTTPSSQPSLELRVAKQPLRSSPMGLDG